MPDSPHHGQVLVVDAANVVGSRPTGWWRDRAKAAADLYDGLLAAIEQGRLDEPLTVVLEGEARRGVDAGEVDRLRVVHAPGSGDDTIADVVAQHVNDGHAVTLVTADRELRERVRQVGGEVVGPSWLLDRL